MLIIGDGRNNYNRPNDWVLREIQQKAKQLIWLNPESRMTWGIGDSEMPRYAPHCHIAEECRSINQLYKIVDLIVPVIEKALHPDLRLPDEPVRFRADRAGPGAARIMSRPTASMAPI